MDSAHLYALRRFALAVALRVVRIAFRRRLVSLVFCGRLVGGDYSGIRLPRAERIGGGHGVDDRWGILSFLPVRVSGRRGRCGDAVYPLRSAVDSIAARCFYCRAERRDHRGDVAALD